MQVANLSFKQYIEECLQEVIDGTQNSLHSALGLVIDMHWHEIEVMEELTSPQFRVDILHNPSICHDRNICPHIKRGDVLLLFSEDDDLPLNIHESDDIPLAIAIDDEDDNFHSAFNIHLVRRRNKVVSYKFVASLGINIQEHIETWLIGNANVENRDLCIINTIMQIPNQVIIS